MCVDLDAGQQSVGDGEMVVERVECDAVRCAEFAVVGRINCCLLYTSPSPRDLSTSRMPSSA